MDEESATTVALPFLLRGRWRNTAMHPARLYGGFWTKFFFLLSVLVALKKKRFLAVNNVWRDWEHLGIEIIFIWACRIGQNTRSDDRFF